MRPVPKDKIRLSFDAIAGWRAILVISSEESSADWKYIHKMKQLQSDCNAKFLAFANCGVTALRRHSRFDYIIHHTLHRYRNPTIANLFSRMSGGLCLTSSTISIIFSRCAGLALECVVRVSTKTISENMAWRRTPNSWLTPANNMENVRTAARSALRYALVSLLLVSNLWKWPFNK